MLVSNVSQPGILNRERTVIHTDPLFRCETHAKKNPGTYFSLFLCTRSTRYLLVRRTPIRKSGFIRLVSASATMLDVWIQISLSPPQTNFSYVSLSWSSRSDCLIAFISISNRLSWQRAMIGALRCFTRLMQSDILNCGHCSRQISSQFLIRSGIFPVISTRSALIRSPLSMECCNAYVSHCSVALHTLLMVVDEKENHRWVLAVTLDLHKIE